MEDITDEDYKQAEKTWKDFKLKSLGDYHDLYVQSDALLLVDVFESIRNKLGPAHFSSVPGLACQHVSKKAEKK